MAACQECQLHVFSLLILVSEGEACETIQLSGVKRPRERQVSPRYKYETKQFRISNAAINSTRVRVSLRIWTGANARPTHYPRLAITYRYFYSSINSTDHTFTVADLMDGRNLKHVRLSKIALARECWDVIQQCHTRIRSMDEMSYRRDLIKIIWLRYDIWITFLICLSDEYV